MLICEWFLQVVLHAQAGQMAQTRGLLGLCRTAFCKARCDRLRMTVLQCTSMQSQRPKLGSQKGCAGMLAASILKQRNQAHDTDDAQI